MKRYIFISPHLDDAAFSAGALMSFLSPNHHVEVINVFTQGSSNLTFSGKQYLKQCGYQDYLHLFQDRVIEDRRALNLLGIKSKNLGFIDALWRQVPRYRIPLAELNAVYPTYRFHITRGKVSPHDQALIKKIAKRLRSIVGGGNVQVYCPVGHGHIDHQIVKLACELAFGIDKLIYWLDFPYSQRTNFQEESYQEVEHKLSAHHYVQKLKICRAYLTQYPLVIGDDQTIMRTAEKYYRYRHSKSHNPNFWSHLKAFAFEPRSYLYNLFSPASPIHSLSARTNLDRAKKKLLQKLKALLPGLEPQLIGSSGIKTPGRDIDIIIPVDNKSLRESSMLLTKHFGHAFKIRKEMVQWKFIYHGIPVDLDLLVRESSRCVEQLLINQAIYFYPKLKIAYLELQSSITHLSPVNQSVRKILFYHDVLTFAKNNTPPHPAKIGRFNFKRQMSLGQVGGQYSFAHYQASDGTQAILKIAKKSRRDRWLQNELAVYRYFENLSFPKGVISPPSLFGAGNHLGKPYLLLEKLAGQPIGNLSPTIKATSLIQVLNCLHNLNSYTPKGVVVRSRLFYLLLFPYRCLKAIIYDFKNIKPVLLALKYLLSHVSSIFIPCPILLIHRDVNDYAVLKYRNRLHLLDFQLSAVGDIAIDWGVILVKYSQESKVVRAIIRYLIREKRDILPLIYSLAVVIAVYDLGEPNGHHHNSKYYLSHILSKTI